MKYFFRQLHLIFLVIFPQQIAAFYPLYHRFLVRGLSHARNLKNKLMFYHDFKLKPLDQMILFSLQHDLSLIMQQLRDMLLYEANFKLITYLLI